MVASSTSPSYCPHFTDPPFFVLVDMIDKNMNGFWCFCVCVWSYNLTLEFFDTYTSPSGVYFEPEMSN